ncbi:calmodulin-like protein 1 [Plakobranchus ocellatus]|uniref:Calmodulin-like protein 1 n=1 Tax=Plakobranchus ocellatus TaxID=259542 RepID=A0AAV3YX28_9GAST|nr:calmodulin-like protein 1 [Plakobranchus ocellatus]
MTMKEKEAPKLSKKASSNNLHRSISKLVLVDAKIKAKAHQKATAARSAVAKKKAGTKGEAPDGKKEVTFAAETKPPDESQEQDEDFLPTLDEDDAEGGDGGDGGDGDKTNKENAEDEQSEENQTTEATEGGEETENNATGEEDKDDKKGGKKGKKKGKTKKEKREEARKKAAAAKKEAEQPVGEVTVGKEQFRSFIFEKVQNALSLVCTDGVTAINVDNVQPLLKSLDINPSQEGVMDLIKDSLIDNFGEMNPLDLDRVVQEAQEADELAEMDDCLEVAFKVIDFDEDGFITQADIYQLMLRLGEMLADYALDDMLDAVDMDKDGKISLRDFRHFLLGRDVPSRKEIFAMAADAKKKRIEAEIKAEEDAEREKFEKLKSGQCAPETEGPEAPDPDSSSLTETKPDQESSTMQNRDDDGSSGGGDGGKNALNAKEPAKSLKDSPEGNVPDTGSSPVSLSQPKSLETSENITKSQNESLQKSITAQKVNESIEIREKREALFPNGATTDNHGCLDKDDSATVLSSSKPTERGASLTADGNSLNLPASYDGDSRHQQRRFSVASSTGASEDEFELRRRSPIPLLRLSTDGAGPLHLDVPPPDLSVVEGYAPSPMPTPLPTPCATPRRRPTIVGIGGLAVGEGEEQELDQSYVDAIEVLRQQMFSGKDGNPVPDRPHRRRNSRHSISDLSDHDGVNTVEDVEDFNNRLVFKLPPRRRSSTVPFPPTSPRENGHFSFSRRGSRDSGSAFHAKRPSTGCENGSGDSDEGIGLADEEIIVKSVYVASGSQAPPPNASSLLRISLPSGDNANPWVEHVPKPGALPPPTVTVDPLDNETDLDSNSKPQQQQSELLSVAAQEGAETPRSTATRSEVSAFNTSLTSPRTDDGGSEDEDDAELPLGNLVDMNSSRSNLRRPVSGKTLVSARSVQSEYDCDADSVLFSINDDNMSTSSQQRRVTYAMDEDFETAEDAKSKAYSPGGRSTPVKLSSKSKNPNLKTSIPCNTIELKELDLKSPVTADQFSNRKRFGMIPRDVSKFLVLGKTPAYTESIVGANTPRSEQYVAPRGSMTPKRLSPTLRLSAREGVDVGIRRQRPQTATTSRERDVLQKRRISLMEDEILPLYDRHRDFDSPSSLEMGGGSNAIEITTTNSARLPGEDTMAQVKMMERRILKRSKTSFDLFPVKEGCGSPLTDTPRSERTIKQRSASASLLRRQQTTPRKISSLSTSPGGSNSSLNGKTSTSDRKMSFSRSVVPLTRVVMAYQNVRKRRQSREFYSLSRELERSGKPLTGGPKSKHSSSPYALDLTNIKPNKPGKKKHPNQGKKQSGGRKSARYASGNSSSGRRGGAEEELPDFPAAAGDDIPTLVGDLSDPDVIPDDVIFEKYRPYTAGGHYHHRHRNGQRSTQSSILTLELPETARHTPKVKSMSLLSKLPIK